MKYGVKIMILAGLFLLSLIPLSLMQGIVLERMQYRDTAVATVAAAQGGEQRLLGPVIQVPVTRYWWVDEKDKDEHVQRVRKFSRELVSFIPEQLSLDENLKAEERFLGIFPVPVYQNHVIFHGRFQWSKNFGQDIPAQEEWIWGEPRLELALQEQRGIRQVSDLRWANRSIAFAAGNRLSVMRNSGVSAPLILDREGGEAVFDFDMSLAGTRSFYVVPMAKQNQVTLRGDWPHPQFTGGQLPDSRDLGLKDFSATWKTNDLASNVRNLWAQCNDGEPSACSAVLAQQVGVSLVDPVDVYQKTVRALKYGFLFTGLSFAAFLLFEIICRMRIHPMQYTMLGLALAVFYLLLLSFSEKTGFGIAYALAASACTLLLSAYVQSIMRKWSRSFWFAFMLSTLYLTLYLILQMEDFALLSGSILLFSLLAAAMWLTRSVDWYQFQSFSNKAKLGSATPPEHELVSDIRL